jgi:hypothetical protein
MYTYNKASLFIRVGLTFAFLYAAIASFIDPQSWIGFFPLFMKNLVSAQVLLVGFSIFEIILALWLLSGWNIKYSALIAAASLFGIVVFNFGAIDIVFRDVALGFAALSLIFIDDHGSEK